MIKKILGHVQLLKQFPPDQLTLFVKSFKMLFSHNTVFPSYNSTLKVKLNV